MKMTLCFIAILSLLGCASIKYVNPSGESFNYSRLGTQKIAGFSMTKDKDGLISVKFDTQEGTEGTLAEALKNISQVAAQIAIKTP